MASKRGVTCPRGVGARWRRRTWRQNVASLAHASGSQVASQDVASKCGVICLRGVREPGWCHRTWRHLPTWREGATFGRRSSCPRGVREPRGVGGRGVKTWRQAPSIYVASQDVASRSEASRHVSSKCVFSRRTICAPPQATTLYSV